MAEELVNSPEVRAKKRLDNYLGMMWHLASFVIINGFLWFLDFIQGGGIEWAYWITVMWGIGFLFHVAAYFIGDDYEDHPRYVRYLEEERQRRPMA